MAALRARHIHCASKIADSFGVSEDAARAFVQSTAAQWNELFAGEGPSHLLVFYQPHDKRTEVCVAHLRGAMLGVRPSKEASELHEQCEWNNSAARCLRHDALVVMMHGAVVRVQEGMWVKGTGAPRLHATYGDDEPVRSKALFFIRAQEKPLEVDKVRLAQRA